MKILYMSRKFCVNGFFALKFQNRSIFKNSSGEESNSGSFSGLRSNFLNEKSLIASARWPTEFFKCYI